MRTAVISSMTFSPAILLLPLFLEHNNFSGAVALENRRFNLGIGQGRARLDISAVFHHQHVAELDPGARFTRKLLQANRLTRFDPILLAARFDHGVHG